MNLKIPPALSPIIPTPSTIQMASQNTPSSARSTTPTFSYEVVSPFVSFNPISFSIVAAPTYAPSPTVASPSPFNPILIPSATAASQSSSPHNHLQPSAFTTSKARRKDEREVYGEILKNLNPLKSSDEGVVNQPSGRQVEVEPSPLESVNTMAKETQDDIEVFEMEEPLERRSGKERRKRSNGVGASSSAAEALAKEFQRKAKKVREVKSGGRQNV